MSNVLFFPYYLLTPHFETDIELMQLELDKGNEVYVIRCENSQTSCDTKYLFENASSISLNCKRCIKNHEIIKKSLSKNVHQINLNEYFDDTMSFPVLFDTIEKFKTIKYKNFEIGFNVCSDLANEIDLKGFECCKDKAFSFIQNGICLYEAIIKIINTYKIDYGYVFNSRFLSAGAFIAAFKSCNKTFYSVERGCNYTKYEILTNSTFHSKDAYYNRVNNSWKKSSLCEDEKAKVAEEYFRKRASGIATSWISFTAKQKFEKLPESFWYYKYKIVIYNSSSFECDYINNEYTCKMYKSQFDGIKHICESLKDNADYGIFLREHPHLSGIDNEQRRSVRTLHYPNFFLIPAESEVSSYNLLFHADKIITFNSTMGIEATFWNKPSICCSNAIYEKLDITYMPDTKEDVIMLITNPELPPKKRDDVIKLGFHESTFGINYKYYKPKTFTSGTYCGKNIGLKLYPFSFRIMFFFRQIASLFWICVYHLVRILKIK